MEFSPTNPVIKLCLQGMQMEENGRSEEAGALFQRSWQDAEDDFEKYITAYFVARHQSDVPDKLEWYETALQYALKVNDDAVKSAFTTLHTNIALCYEELGAPDNAKRHRLLADSFATEPSDAGPFYHGTKADLHIGDLLTAGRMSNYKTELQMNHIYFTALANGAGLAASLAKGDGHERVYVVAPTGAYENDPNVTDKKFPGNPTRSYRTTAPLRVIGEVADWAKQTPGEIQKWRDKLANNTGEIIN